MGRCEAFPPTVSPFIARQRPSALRFDGQSRTIAPMGFASPLPPSPVWRISSTPPIPRATLKPRAAFRFLSSNIDVRPSVSIISIRSPWPPPNAAPARERMTAALTALGPAVDLERTRTRPSRRPSSLHCEQTRRPCGPPFGSGSRPMAAVDAGNKRSFNALVAKRTAMPPLRRTARSEGLFPVVRFPAGVANSRRCRRARSFRSVLEYLGRSFVRC